MFAFLGALLLGIGLASGLIPLNPLARRPESAPTQAAARPRPGQPKPQEKPNENRRRQTEQAAGRSMAAIRREPRVDVRAILAQAPCPDPDTFAVERLLREGAVADPSHLRAVACEASTGYKAASPDTTPPESSATGAAPSGATFITPSDSISR